MAGLAWDTTKLPVDGSIIVEQASFAANTNASVSENQALLGPLSVLGFRTSDFRAAAGGWAAIGVTSEQPWSVQSPPNVV
jgi:hypothetical protein